MNFILNRELYFEYINELPGLYRLLEFWCLILIIWKLCCLDVLCTHLTLVSAIIPFRDTGRNFFSYRSWDFVKFPYKQTDRQTDRQTNRWNIAQRARTCSNVRVCKHIPWYHTVSKTNGSVMSLHVPKLLVSTLISVCLSLIDLHRAPAVRYVLQRYLYVFGSGASRR